MRKERSRRIQDYILYNPDSKIPPVALPRKVIQYFTFLIYNICTHMVQYDVLVYVYIG
jgi:hypothetical protein